MKQLRSPKNLIVGIGLVIGLLIGILWGHPSAGAESVIRFDPASYRWQHRLILIFAPSSDNEEYQVQQRYLMNQTAALAERDLLVLEAFNQGDSQLKDPANPNFDPDDAVDPDSIERLYQRYQISKDNSFTLLLIGKDGTVKRRVEEPIEMAVLYTQIDGMPMRQREMRERSNP